jgi:hypothetical protein
MEREVQFSMDVPPVFSPDRMLNRPKGTIVILVPFLMQKDISGMIDIIHECVKGPSLYW